MVSLTESDMWGGKKRENAWVETALLQDDEAALAPCTQSDFPLHLHISAVFLLPFPPHGLCSTVACEPEPWLAAVFSPPELHRCGRGPPAPPVLLGTDLLAGPCTSDRGEVEPNPQQK